MSLHGRICTAIFAPMPFTAVWEIGLYAAVDGQPPALLVAAGGAPMLATVVALVAILAEYDSRPEPAVPVPAQTRRAVHAPTRRELSR